MTLFILSLESDKYGMDLGAGVLADDCQKCYGSVYHCGILSASLMFSSLWANGIRPAQTAYTPHSPKQNVCHIHY